MIKTKKLDNGTNVILAPIKGTKAVTILVLFPVGSRFEDSKHCGASHFVEHLMFKGTDKYPTAQHISRTLESVGADYNAFTSKDYTGYYIKINSGKQELAFDLLSDMLFNSKMNEDEVKREKGVIKEEIKMYDDNPTMAVDQLFDRIIFGDHPLGRDIAGTVKSVDEMTRDQLYNYYKKYYRGDNMVVVVAGDIARGKKLNKYLSYFTDKNNKPKNGSTKTYKKFAWPKNKKLVDRVEVKKMPLDQAHIMIGFPGIKYSSKSRYPIAVLTNILGMGMKSRLFVEVRERRGLAYMVRAGLGFHRDAGTFQIQAGLDISRLGEAIQVIKDELKKIQDEPVTNKELKEAKGNLIGGMYLGMEDSSSVADWYAKQFWFGNDMYSTSEVAKMLNKVTVKQVQQIAKEIFVNNMLHLAIIGNISKTEVLKMLN